MKRTDLIVGSMIVASLSFGFIAADNAAAERARRIKCASNLRQIGQALMLYANENKGAFPRTVFDKTKADKAVAFTHPKAKDPFSKEGPEANDVSADIFMLLRTQDITSDVFICYSTDD